MVILVDAADKIDAFLPQLDELNVRGVIALDDVDIVHPGQLPEAAR